MQKEQEVYIESYLEKLVSLTVEANYKIDKFGNIVFENKKALIERIKDILLETGQELNMPVEEINECLLNVYKERSEHCENPGEYLEIIELLQKLNEDKEESKEKQTSEEKDKTD